MRKYIIAAIFCIVFCSSNLFSQGSGYMGRHLFVNAEVVNSPCYFRPNVNGKTSYFAFDYILNPSIEYVLGTRMTIGASFVYHKSLFEDVGSIVDGDYEYYYWEGSMYTGRYNTSKTIGGGLFYKIYYGNAAFGNYFKAEVNLLNVSSDAQNELKEPISFIMGGGRVEFGKDFLFFNRLKLNMGIGAGITFGGGSIVREMLDGADTMKESAGTRVARNYIFGLRMGVGFLAF
ncbi:hypothetical protein LJC68_03980 [Bacteroidales bacterium OttesenSCG-928-B11]|nr:hypothetical protein [Bacteroidales bacterium OttesenSCG-928-E04]MDL2309443.1 hypothetical protein [Bacteroidales bacterium OttesenSCG-928-C03]MDL2312018.1 hypothetical protein [Bacteroidales bacterium OttesenSCG-928-B11]MDL2326937.1 hypothetical protein [Bacteroidales bacterium OttesenSCG-928-A14]